MPSVGMLSRCFPEHSVRDAYRLAWERCKMNGDGVPRASAIQELVTVWKQLWEWRRKKLRRAVRLGFSALVEHGAGHATIAEDDCFVSFGRVQTKLGYAPRRRSRVIALAQKPTKPTNATSDSETGFRDGRGRAHRDIVNEKSTRWRAKNDTIESRTTEADDAFWDHKSRRNDASRTGTAYL